MATTTDPVAAISGKQIVLLAVKPQNASSLMDRLSTSITPDQLLVSIIAGITTEAIEGRLQSNVPVIRSMPQLLAFAGVAATAICPGGARRTRTAAARQGTVRSGRKQRRRRRTPDGCSNGVVRQRPRLRLFNYRSPRRGWSFRGTSGGCRHYPRCPDSARSGSHSARDRRKTCRPESPRHLAERHHRRRTAGASRQRDGRRLDQRRAGRCGPFTGTGPMIAVIDYGMGNLRSVQKAFEYLGFDAAIVESPAAARGASHLVLPGDAAFGDAMRNLRGRGWDEFLLREVETGKPFLGICVGLQLMFAESEERGRHRGLSMLPGTRYPFSNWRTCAADRLEPDFHEKKRTASSTAFPKAASSISSIPTTSTATNRVTAWRRRNTAWTTLP